MSSIEVVKTDKGLRGFGDEDRKRYAKFKKFVDEMEPGEIIRFEWKQPRNLGMHRKFFALVNYVAQNSDVYDTTDKALTAIKIAAGHCDFVPWNNGDLIAVPKSISFAEMDQAGFEDFYANAINGVLNHILKHMNRTSLDEALNTIAEF